MFTPRSPDLTADLHHGAAVAAHPEHGATTGVGVNLASASVLTIASGAAFGAAFPPLALRPLAWVALVPFLIVVRRGSLRRAALLGALWACAMTFVTSDCLPDAVVRYFEQPPLVGWLVLLGATLLTMVPYYGAFAAAYWILARRHAAALPLLAATAWVGAELARVTVLGGNPWAVSGYSQSGVLPLMQLAEVTGVHGVGFLVLAVNAALAELLLARRATLVARLRAQRAAACVAALLLVTLVYGALRMRALDRAAGEPPVAIAIVQGNLDLDRQWRREMYGQNLDTYLRLTHEAIAGTAPRLVFWPESAMTFFLAEEPAYRSALRRVLAPRAVELIAGGPRRDEAAPDDAARYLNATFAIAPDGGVRAWQDKGKLLPFAETFPLESLDLLRRDFGNARQFTPGVARAPLPSAAGAAGVVVCNEAMYPELARERVAAGAEYLVNPANDSWFGALKYSLQARDIARWRAVEQRRYLVRASTAGPSGVIDPLGRIVTETVPFTRGWVSGAIRPSRGTTLYHRLGDAFALACGLIAVVAVGAAWRRGAGGSGARRG